MLGLSDWQETAGFVTVIGTAAGVAMRSVLARARTGMTPASAHADLTRRVDAIEQALATLPKSAEVTALTARVASVEKHVAVVGATLDGVANGVRRVEHMMDLLVQNELKKDPVK